MPERLKRFFFIFSVILLVNLFLFVVFPNFVLYQDRSENSLYLQDYKSLQLVHLEKPKPVKNKPKQKKRYPKKQKSKEALVPKQVEIEQEIENPKPKELEIDPMDLRIHPRLASKIKLGPPPAPKPELEAKAVFDYTGNFSESEVDRVPMAVVKTAPVYPYRAKRLNLNGKVKVKFLVDKNGEITKVEILDSKPEGIFDQSVIQAVSSWKFRPGKIKGHIVNTWMVTTIIFNIDEV